MLIEAILDAQKNGRALGHFNISNLEMFWGVVRAAQKQHVPVIIGVSEGERAFMGLPEVIALVKSLGGGYPGVFVNADHTYTSENVREAIDAGCDSVIADGAKLSRAENVAFTKEAVAYAHASGNNVLIEGELGYIGQGSEVVAVLPEGAAVTSAMMTSPEDAAVFVKETNVGLFAPAVGNIHGIVRSGSPNLDIPRIKAIKDAVGVPLVLHGGSGTSDDDLRAAIGAGISVIHISTDLRVAYKTALEKSLERSGDDIAPYRLLQPAVEAVGRVVERYLTLFSAAAA